MKFTRIARMYFSLSKKPQPNKKPNQTQTTTTKSLLSSCSSSFSAGSTSKDKWLNAPTPRSSFGLFPQFTTDACMKIESFWKQGGRRSHFCCLRGCLRENIELQGSVLHPQVCSLLHFISSETFLQVHWVWCPSQPAISYFSLGFPRPQNLHRENINWAVYSPSS